MASKVVIDANVLVALVDVRDKWHLPAIALRDALVAEKAQLIFFDCAVNETVGVIGRRVEEQGRAEQFTELLDTLSQHVPLASITWIAKESERLYEQILALCRSQGGRLNFNDALMALLCREQELRYIASFDRDFDQLPWVMRLSTPVEVQEQSQE